MTPTFRKVALIAAVLGLILSVFVAACGSDDDDEAAPATTAPATTAPPETVTTTRTTTAPEPKPKPKPPAVQTIRITVVGGRPQGGIQRPTVQQGKKVALVVTSDLAGEVHVHGYDLDKAVAAGGTARLPFTARIPGRFEVELHGPDTQLAELEVRP